ncbi:MAG: long-chain-acyl-CoA synthetase [Pseudomonadales bacterium]|nr:long-chain-acyl-CoA synthetase [Pseudomonadales bacterium]
MKHGDVITISQVAAKLPGFMAGLPSMLKGLRVGNATDLSKPMGLGRCVEQATEENPNGFAILYDDTALTYTQFNAWANRIAHYLVSIGIQKGDTVVVMLENRPELLATVTACAKIGAVSALVNTSQRGKVLVHSINLVKPRIAIVGEELAEAYSEVESELVISPDQKYYWADQDTLKDAGSAPAGWVNLADTTANQPENNLPQTQQVFAEDACFYIYTSGTTGMPKAVVFNHGRYMKAYGNFGYSAVRLTPSDRMYICLPFYHATAMAVCWGSILAGSSALVLSRKFSASRFWDEINQHQATAFGYVGELCRYLMDQPVRPSDRNNKVRIIVGNGLRPSIWRGFKDRFGIEKVMEFYASSEGNIGFTNVMNFDNTVGLSPLPYAIVRYDKENERPVRDSKGRMIKVKKGEAGLLIGKITPKSPFHGYTDPEKTRQCIFEDVFQKGDAWFNTGDLMRDMGFKHAQFVDRLGDTFRWKGENVSTTEVERICDSIESVSETVVYGVEIPNTNGRAGMASMRLECDHTQFDFSMFLKELQKELPHYAIPVFLRVSSGMETTGTFKHKKAPLKEDGFNLAKVADPVYVCLPKADTYVQLTDELQAEIEAGKYRY